MGKPKTQSTPAHRNNSAKYYAVQSLLGRKLGQHGQLLYKVRWKGYRHNHDTWEPLSHLDGAAKLVKEFDQMQDLKDSKKIRIKIPKIKEDQIQAPSSSHTGKTQKVQGNHKILASIPTQTALDRNQQVEQIKQNNQQQQHESSDVEYYQVEKIVDKKSSRSGRKTYYRIRWTGFKPSQDTWQPTENLRSVRHLVDQFDELRKTKKIGKAGNSKFYKVEKIIDRRFINREVQYRVRWSGYSQQQDTWEPLTNLKNVTSLVRKFDQEADSRNKAYEEVGCTLKQTDNYEVGGFYQVSSMENANQISQQFRLDQQSQEEFISVNLQENDLMEPGFL